MPGIIWLASYPKSGNTWLRAFIANYFKNPDRPLPINELHKFAFGDGFLVHYERVSGRPKEELGEEELRALRPQVHRYWASYPNETAFVKTHNMVGDEGGVPIITPQATAGAVYVVRNPLDVVVSYAHHYMVPLDEAVDDLCERYKVIPGEDGKKIPDFIGDWSQHVRSWTEAPGLKPHTMRYEDMLKKPGPTFRALVKFLGVPLTTNRLRKAIKFTSFEEMAKQEQRDSFNEARPDGAARFFRKGQTGQWRESLNDEQVRRMVDAHRETMQRFGYLDKSGEPV
jgi:hypothetical protein